MLKAWLKKWVFNCRWKVKREVVNLISQGFHNLGATIEKALSCVSIKHSCDHNGSKRRASSDHLKPDLPTVSPCISLSSTEKKAGSQIDPNPLSILNRILASEKLRDHFSLLESNQDQTKKIRNLKFITESE